MTVPAVSRRAGTASYVALGIPRSVRGDAPASRLGAGASDSSYNDSRETVIGLVEFEQVVKTDRRADCVAVSVLRAQVPVQSPHSGLICLAASELVESAAFRGGAVSVDAFRDESVLVIVGRFVGPSPPCRGVGHVNSKSWFGPDDNTYSPPETQR